MSEMQTLKVQPLPKESTNKRDLIKEIKIDPVDQKTKYKVLDWLSSEVKLLKYNEKLLNDLPLYCKNGVFFADLINRLNGKHPILKGIDRNPKNMTAIVANMNKVMEYFRSFPRFSARYLWA